MQLKPINDTSTMWIKESYIKNVHKLMIAAYCNNVHKSMGKFLHCVRMACILRMQRLRWGGSVFQSYNPIFGVTS